MMRFSRLLFLMGLLILPALVATLPQPASAVREGRPLATDKRIQTLMYTPDEVYRFTGHYSYQSAIEFASDEEVQTISMGDSVAWLIEPSGNRIFLKPLEQNATTNMTVLTNKRSYLFELHAREASGIDDPQLVFVLRFMYPSDGGDYTSNESTAPDDAVPDLQDPEVRGKLNFNYTLRGKPNISPIRVFDDGEFTFFEFRNKNADVPAFFLVDSEGKEALINYRVRGDYIVLERVWGRYTLRYGPDQVCVYNESWNASLAKNTATQQATGAGAYAASGPASPMIPSEAAMAPAATAVPEVR